jgi:ribosomal protein S18 acetylase RimI-like enzyme
MSYCIRRAKGNDQPSLFLMMQAHAKYEGHQLEFLEKQQHRQLEALPVTIFVVTINDELVGYMSVIKQFSTWELDWYLYLDCLYLNESTRGLGVGLQLMEKLKGFAKKNMIKTIQWQTPEDNLLAIEFYQKLGATSRHKQRFSWAV